MVNKTIVIIKDALVAIYLCFIDYSSYCNEQELLIQQQFCGNNFVFEFKSRKYAEFIFMSRINPNFHETQLVFLMLYSCFRTLDKSFFSVLFLT